MKVEVHVTLKDDVLDPQGKTVSEALDHFGYAGVSDMRIGKYIVFDLVELDEAKAKANVKKMCEEVLTNPVIEKYEFFLHGAKA